MAIRQFNHDGMVFHRPLKMRMWSIKAYQYSKQINAYQFSKPIEATFIYRNQII